MKNKIFQSGDYYNLFYENKDYELEAKYIHNKLVKHNLKGKSILELGCGTGKHANKLSELGYEILGIEKSESMIKKIEKSKNFDFRLGDIRKIKLEKKFDSVISLFHVLSYQISNESLKSVFLTAFNSLKNEGIFLFDFWFAPAVIHQKPSIRIKKIKTKNNTIYRIAEPEIFIDKNQVNVKYTFHDFHHETNKFTISKELHKMRYFSIPELEYIGRSNGFQILETEEFLTGSKPSLNTWGVCIIFKKNG